MVLRGLEKYGYYELAREIARSHVDQVTKVFNRTGTVWENYAPESPRPGEPAKKDFVGWTGLSPIAVTIEHLFGITADAGHARLTWRIGETARHGVERYPLKDGWVTLICPAHAPGEEPDIELQGTTAATVEVIWPSGHTKTYTTGA